MRRHQGAAANACHAHDQAHDKTSKNNSDFIHSVVMYSAALVIQTTVLFFLYADQLIHQGLRGSAVIFAVTTQNESGVFIKDMG